MALVLPGEVVALPDVCPAVAAGVLARTPLEAVPLTSGVGVGRLRLIQQLAQVEEVLVRGGALGQRGSAPFGNEGVRSHSGALASKRCG